VESVFVVGENAYSCVRKLLKEYKKTAVSKGCSRSIFWLDLEFRGRKRL